MNGMDDNHVTLQHHIPVYITYFTAKVNDDGTLSTYRDLYGHDARMIAALNGRAVPYDLPGSSEEVAEQQPQRPNFRRGRQSDAFNDFARALFNF